jgi:hypothetical protein
MNVVMTGETREHIYNIVQSGCESTLATMASLNQK